MLPSPSAAFSGLVSTHLALSDSVRFPGNRDRRLSVLTLLADSPCVKWNVGTSCELVRSNRVTGSSAPLCIAAEILSLVVMLTGAFLLTQSPVVAGATLDGDQGEMLGTVLPVSPIGP